MANSLPPLETNTACIPSCSRLKKMKTMKEIEAKGEGIKKEVSNDKATKGKRMKKQMN
jgi:hypothetical protein